MQIGVFSVDKNNQILSLSSGTLNFARQDKENVTWYGRGKLDRNDLVVFLGFGFADAGWDTRSVFGDNLKDISDSGLVICRYGDRECFPFIKPVIAEDFNSDNCFVDTIYSGEKITLTQKHNEINVCIDHQSCTLKTDGKGCSLLVLKNRDGIKYFSHDRFVRTNMKSVLEGSEYEPYISEGEFPIPASDFFDDCIVRSLGKLKKADDTEYVKLHGRAVVVRRLEGARFQEDSALFSIGDESGYLKYLKLNVEIYNKLYFSRQVKVTNNELGCEARLKGCGKEIEKINKQLDKVCHKNVTIVLTGESGTGKTYLAREIHKNGKRAEGPFINVNCASIAYNLIESELFGYEEGAFTGARRGGKIGYFELAKRGTLFLDEISELPIKLQGKLLEVLQEGTFYRVGGTSKISADVRLIVATNRNLEEMVKQGKFREDLYYRINVFPIHLPPLRERLDDLYSIIEDTLPSICDRLEIEPLMLTQKAIDKMKKYTWPGNIRELENVLEKAAVMAEGSLIREEDINLDNPIAGGNIPQTMKERVEDFEREILNRAFEQFHGDRKQVADFLGVSKTNLFDKIHKYGIKEGGANGGYHEHY
jgi:Response regulator containing CheY-like receiver, AAA-type ATPase, and DNA-binding domains